MPNTSLYDLAVLNRADAYTGLVEDVTTLAPEFSTFSAHPRDGTWYWITKRIAYPTAQFRVPNAGTSTSKSVYKKEVKELFFLDTQLQMDEAIWEADDGNLGALWQLEAEGAMRAASILIGQQTWYGTSADASGFTGAKAQLAQSVAAGGTTNSTSAMLVWMDPQHGCRYDVGQNGSFAITPPLRQQVKDASSNTFFAYVGNLKAWIGFNVMSNYSVFGVTGVTSTITQWLTDGAGSRLLAKIPVARRSNLRWFMNRTAQATLQQSRTTVNIGMGTGAYAVQSNQAIASYQPANASGLPAFSPLPENLIGYPITLTDSLLDTETNS